MAAEWIEFSVLAITNFSGQVAVAFGASVCEGNQTCQWGVVGGDLGREM